jgi:hypothetical protein
LEAYTSKPPDIIACIRTWIKQPANAEILKALDAWYKKKFNDQFPEDIPHAKDLPTTFTTTSRSSQDNPYQWDAHTHAHKNTVKVEKH